MSAPLHDPPQRRVTSPPGTFSRVSIVPGTPSPSGTAPDVAHAAASAQSASAQSREPSQSLSAASVQAASRSGGGPQSAGHEHALSAVPASQVPSPQNRVNRRNTGALSPLPSGNVSIQAPVCPPYRITLLCVPKLAT